MSRIDKIMSVLCPIIIVALLVFYYFVNPSLPNFPIKCVWHELTGTQCPGCGMQRALHAFIHGEYLKSLGYNYFFALSVPYAFLAVLVSWYNYNHVFDTLKKYVFHPYTLKAYVFLYMFWWVLRNILSV